MERRNIAIRRDSDSEWRILPDKYWHMKRGDVFMWPCEDSDGDVDALEIESAEDCHDMEWPSIWVTLVPDWVKHISVSDNKKITTQKTACGLTLRRVWMFLDEDHAENTVRFGSRLLPCQHCVAALKATNS